MLTRRTRTVDGTGRAARSGTALLAAVALLAALADVAETPEAPAAGAGDHRLASQALAAGLLGGPGGYCPPDKTNCDVWDNDPGDPGGPGGGDGGGGDNGGGSGGGDRKCVLDGKPVPCYDDVKGWFNSADGCYYKLAADPPDGGSEGGQWYTKTCDRGGGPSSVETVQLPAPPPGFGAPPDPEELARDALASITLEQPPVGVAPRRSGVGLVGLPVWLWTSSEPGTWGPLHASAEDRGLRVTITAEVDRIVWDMGNGDRKTCRNPGVPYEGQGGESPKCGYKGYPRPSGDRKYEITATTHWQVVWTASSGANGVINVTRTSNPAYIRIDELQVVTK